MLAIVIPYYKLTFFRETLESLAAQTDKRFHVYIGNDASPEDPEELLKEFEGKFLFTYKKFDENLGGRALTKQWERCIAMMQDEEWFMILGDDDVLGNNVVEEFFKNTIISHNEFNVIRYSTIVIDENSHIIFSKYTQPVFEDPLESFLRKVSGTTRSSLSEYIFRTAVYNKIGFVDLRLAWGTDDLAALQLAADKKIFSINNAVVYFRISKENISGKKDNLVIKTRENIRKIKFLFKNYNFLLSRYSKQQCIKYLDFYTFSMKDIDFESYYNLVLLSIKNGEIKLALSILKNIAYKLLPFKPRNK